MRYSLPLSKYQTPPKVFPDFIKLKSVKGGYESILVLEKYTDLFGDWTRLRHGDSCMYWKTYGCWGIDVRVTDGILRPIGKLGEQNMRGWKITKSTYKAWEKDNE